MHRDKRFCTNKSAGGTYIVGQRAVLCLAMVQNMPEMIFNICKEVRQNGDAFRKGIKWNP